MRAPTILLALVILGSEATVFRFDGEVNIGVLVNLHHPASLVPLTYNRLDHSPSECGIINVDAVQQAIAAKWATEVINNQSLPHELRIGIQLHDTCNEEDLTQKHLFEVIRSTRIKTDTKSKPPILGMIGVGDPDSLAQTSGALHAFNIPLISASPEQSERVEHNDNILTTAPDMSGQARAVANLAYEMNLKSVTLISSSHKIIQIFLSEATTLGISVPRILELNPKQSDQPQQVESFLRHLARQQAVVLIVKSHEAVAIAEHLKHQDLGHVRPLWLIGSLGLDLRVLSGWRRVFHGGIFVEPHMPELRAFRNYFIESLQQRDETIRSIIEEYKEEMFGCTHNPSSADTFLLHCDHIPEDEIEMRFQQDPHVSFVVKAISAITAAFRLVQLEKCADDVRADCLRHVDQDTLHEAVLSNLKKLSFSTMLPSESSGLPEIEGTKHHFTRNGRLVANKQEVYIIDKNYGLDKIGWYSEDEGLHLTDSLESFISTEIPKSSPLINDEQVRSTFARSISDTHLTASEIGQLKVSRSYNQLPIFSYESFISRTWTLVVLSVAIVGFMISLWMLIYVFQKICDGTLAGNQFMGVMLLIGVMFLFTSVIPWLLPPNETICALRHFMHPLIMVVCFSILLVKSMQLRSLVTIGLGGRIPMMNQVVSMIFMIVVQLVIAVEWYLSTTPIGIQITNGYPECKVSQSRFLLLHIYPIVLLLLSFFYGISVIKIKRNFNEGRWITCATIFIIPIFAAWPMVYYFAPVPFHDPSVAVSVLAVAGILLTAIFLPKMHTISQQSKFRKAANGIDLSRTHSDATVYTGFSDYLTYGGKTAMYPIYGYTTNQFIPIANASKDIQTSGKRRKSHVTHASGANVKSYTDWSQEHTPNHYHNMIATERQQHTLKLSSKSRKTTSKAKKDHQIEHKGFVNVVKDDSPVDFNELEEWEKYNDHERHRKQKVRGMSTKPLEPSDDEWPANDQELEKRIPKVDYSDDEDEDEDYQRIRQSRSTSTNRFPATARLHRQMHSQSPSDGMILTASGLTPSTDDRKSPGYRVSEVFLTH